MYLRLFFKKHYNDCVQRNHDQEEMYLFYCVLLQRLERKKEIGTQTDAEKKGQIHTIRM